MKASQRDLPQSFYDSYVASIIVSYSICTDHFCFFPFLLFQQAALYLSKTKLK